MAHPAPSGSAAAAAAAAPAADAADVDVSEAEAAERAHRGMDLMQLVFQLGVSAEYVPDKAAVRADVLRRVEEDHMTPLYQSLCAEHGWPVDEALLARLKAANAEALARADVSIAEAREKFGEVEVFDRQVAKAQYFVRIGDAGAALAAYADISGKHVSTGQKVDMAMAKARLALQHGDLAAAKEHIAEAKECVPRGARRAAGGSVAAPTAWGAAVP
jgi:hypothetical protein